MSRIEAIAALADTNERITALEQQRTKLLIDCDDRALDTTEAELAELRRYAARLGDRIAALEAQAREAEEEARRRFRSQIVDRFEHLLIIKAAPLEEELEETIAKADQLFREIIAIREEARAAWPHADSHHDSLAGSVDGCALSGAAVQSLLCFELYRVGARPVPTGVSAASRQPNFPGGVCPRLDLLMTPSKIVPFARALRQATNLAIDAMRTKLDPLASEAAGVARMGEQGPAVQQPAAVAVPAAPVVLSPEQKRLAALLKRQEELAADTSPEGEAAYQAVVAEIANMETPTS